MYKSLYSGSTKLQGARRISHPEPHSGVHEANRVELLNTRLAKNKKNIN